MAMLQTELDAISVPLGYSEVSKLVHDLSLKVFVMETSRPLPYWMDSEVREYCLAKWDAFHVVRMLRKPGSLHDYVRCWRAVAVLLRTTRSYRRKSKGARNLWVHKICKDAAEKADMNDPSFYKLLRVLSPKRSSKIAGVSRMLEGTSSMVDEGKVAATILFGTLWSR